LSFLLFDTKSNLILWAVLTTVLSTKNNKAMSWKSTPVKDYVLYITLYKAKATLCYN